MFVRCLVFTVLSGERTQELGDDGRTFGLRQMDAQEVDGNT